LLAKGLFIAASGDVKLIWQTGRRLIVLERSSICAIAVALAAALILTHGVWAADEPKYPDWKGQWNRFVIPGVAGPISFDPTKPGGLGQQAPLTAEYQKALADSLADQSAGGPGNNPTARCLFGGMPQMMTAFMPLEIIVTPETTYIMLTHEDPHRRIYTDGRDWPKEIAATFQGYSIGHWIDEDGDGRYDVLEIETRGPFKGPRTYDVTGLPLHEDGQTVFKERIYLDKADANILYDEITVIDHALTRPWTADKRYVRNPNNPRPTWPEYVCTENNGQITIDKQSYYLSANGLLMPTRKDQPPPDLRFFKQTQK
jgi:hypothetical protein